VANTDSGNRSLDKNEDPYYFWGNADYSSLSSGNFEASSFWSTLDSNFMEPESRDKKRGLGRTALPTEFLQVDKIKHKPHADFGLEVNGTQIVPKNQSSSPWGV
jgi:hypothetical protein